MKSSEMLTEALKVSRRRLKRDEERKDHVAELDRAWEQGFAAGLIFALKDDTAE